MSRSGNTVEQSFVAAVVALVIVLLFIPGLVLWLANLAFG
jgi:hypothetical protein